MKCSVKLIHPPSEIEGFVHKFHENLLNYNSLVEAVKKSISSAREKNSLAICLLWKNSDEQMCFINNDEQLLDALSSEKSLLKSGDELTLTLNVKLPDSTLKPGSYYNTSMPVASTPSKSLSKRSSKSHVIPFSPTPMKLKDNKNIIYDTVDVDKMESVAVTVKQKVKEDELVMNVVEID